MSDRAEIERLRAENEELGDTVADLNAENDKLRANALTAEEAKALMEEASFENGFSGDVGRAFVKLQRIASQNLPSDGE